MTDVGRLPDGLLPSCLLGRLPPSPLLPTVDPVASSAGAPRRGRPPAPLSPPPPPLDFAQLTYPYTPTWSVLRRMRSSELPVRPSARESVVDLGAFFDEDDDSGSEAGECDALRPDGKRARELQLQCAGPVRALMLFFVLALFACACVAHVKRGGSPLRFMREKV